MELNWNQPYPSRRSPVFAKNIVASSQPLAVQAGLHMLRSGGNAVDAALATAIALTVVEPTSNGIGSDVFAMVWDGKKLHGLNSSGRSPAAWTPEAFQKYDEMPLLGWDTVTVPGAVAAWALLSKRFGRLPFEKLFEPAIQYARNGFHVSPITASHWASAPRQYSDFANFGKTFLPGGRAPKAGELFRCPDQATALELIAGSDGQSFYSGQLANAMVDSAKQSQAGLSLDDLGKHEANWVEPISINYQGYDIHELPPNGQGLIALIALGILEHCLPFQNSDIGTVDDYHFQIEACKVALELSQKFLADPKSMKIAVEKLLSASYLSELAQSLSITDVATRILTPHTEDGTVYLSAADENGMMVSFIQSNYCGFGSGIVIPNTGISLQNRGYGFNLISGHPNEVGPNKLPFHTIIPGFVSRDGLPVMSFGVMGGPMQAQGHMQMILRIVRGGENPQSASDAPRWYIHHDGVVGFETGADEKLVEELQKRGHKITRHWPASRYGGAQIIMKMNDGYCGASDHRKDGQAAGF